MLMGKIPVTVITGFLGAGKTTLVNCLLSDNRHLRLGVVVNEFGELGIDGALIDADEDAIVEINNGCICCTVRVDLVRSILRLLDSASPPLERLIVETSGLADPAPVLQSFLADPALRERVFLESVVTVVDAQHAVQVWHDPVAREQIAFADVVLVSKCEALPAAAYESIERELRTINPTATVERTFRGESKVQMFGTCRFSIAQALDIEPDLLVEGAHDHEHDSSITAWSLASPGSLDAARFNTWMNRLVQSDGKNLLRMKGILSLAGEPRRYHFHGVHMLLETTPGKRWLPCERRETQLVFIGRALDARALSEQFRACAVAVQRDEAPPGSPA
ncbi:GTPase, G3E family [Polaromonas sp. YR568]|nr:GTPase, G3E family [Polaromonas sp. YR568]